MTLCHISASSGGVGKYDKYGKYCHPQTDCFVVSQLFSMARHGERLKLGSKPAQLYVWLRIRPLDQQAYQLGNYKVLCSNSCSSVRLFTFYTLPDTRVLNSFEELCIMRAAAENSFAGVLNTHEGGYILSFTDNTVSLYHNSSVWLDT